MSYGFYAMLYRASSLVQIANALHGAIWNASAPGCLANDVALAAVSDRIRGADVDLGESTGLLGRHAALDRVERADVFLLFFGGRRPMNLGPGEASNEQGHWRITLVFWGFV